MKKTLASAFGFIVIMFTPVVWAAPVPDTGQTKCYNNTVEIPCSSPGQPFYGQDANYTINPISYTKLDGSGNVLPDSATSWVMVKDNVTGLIWEMKTNKDGVKNYNDPHDADNTYTWYDNNPATNGGYPGTPGDGTDTEDFIKALNDANFGGYIDWRLPTVKELTYIVNYSIFYPGPTIDTGYFPDTVPNFYWASTTDVSLTKGARGVDFRYGNDSYFYKRYGFYVRAVRGGQSESLETVDSGLMDDALTGAGSYVDNGDGTIADTSTGLTWQQTGSSNTQTWEQSLAYCENLNLGGYTDWRMPTIKELGSLVDYSRSHPAINTTYFTNMVLSFYWASSTYASNTNGAWGVYFGYGGDRNYADKYNSNYVRAVRSGQYLVVSPVSLAVVNVSGTTTFSVSNTGAGTMSWTASVTSGCDWLMITSGASGSDAGTITCSFTENISTSARIANIRVTATGATGSPVDVMVTQAPTSCMATLDGSLSLHIPILSHLVPYLGAPSYWADLVYEYNPAYPVLILFKLANVGIISNPTFSCAASTLSDIFTIHIPDVLLPDGITHMWVDLIYSMALSIDGNAYFYISSYGILKPTACVATINENYLLHLPYISYGNGALSLRADFVYEFNPTYPTLIFFKLTNVEFIINPSFSCAASTLSYDLTIQVPDVLLPDGSTHLWVDLEYNEALSSTGNTYFVVTKYGAVSN